MELFGFKFDLGKSMKSKKNTWHALKVASSNTLKTRVVKSKKKFNRKPKHKKAEHDQSDYSAFLFY
jgi:hypothetical protein